MNLPVVLFVVFAVLLIALLLWAALPPRRWTSAEQDVFALLSQPRHCLHIPHILRALRPEDTDFLQQGGKDGLMQAVRQQRCRIALQYLDQLQDEFEMLLEISRKLAVMAPEIITMQEMERWKLSSNFALNCTLLRWRLRFGLRPWEGFNLLSRMATEMIRTLEAATTRIAEVAVRGSALPAAGSAEEGSDL